MQAVLSRVLRKVQPHPKERERFQKLSERALSLANEEAKKHDAEAILAGSLTRDTWLVEKNEFDVFVIFPKDLPEEKLEKFGLELGKKVIKGLGGKWRIEYAQHPYVRGEVGKIQIDVVPCYKVESGEKIKSAVDRTPFHVKYLNENLTKEMADDVRLLKQLLHTSGIYGADAKTQGFSGYICEVLIIRYENFSNLLKDVAKWKPGEIIDVEKHWNEKDHEKLRKKFKGEVLIVIDPVDKNRNAASAISAQNFYKFKKIAEEFLKSPREEFFFERKIKPLTKDELRKHAKVRGTELIIVKFKPPDVVPDVLWPQLRRAMRRLGGILRQHEFGVMRSDCWTDEDDLAAIILEIETKELSLINKRVGPSVFELKDSLNFIKKYEKRALVGPFLEGNNWCVEIKRDWTRPSDKLKDSLKDDEKTLIAKGIPNHIAKEIGKKFQVVHELKDVERMLKNDGFAIFLRGYFEKEKLI